MKICFIAHPAHTNSKSWIRHFAEVLGHDVHVVAVADQVEPIPGATLHEIAMPIEQKWRYFQAVPRVRQMVRSIDPDLLIGYRVQSNGFLAACTGVRPLVLAAQSEHIVSPPESKLAAAIASFAVRQADLCNAWGPLMGQRFCDLGAPPGRVVVRPRGVDTRAFHPPDPERPAWRATRGPVLCTTRQLHPVYRHDFLIEVMRRIADEHPDALLLVVGRGPAEEAIRKQVADLKLERNVELVGYVEHRNVAEYLKRAHLYVSVIDTDGVSSSLLEAMACGCYPIVPDIAPNRVWISSGENGTLAGAAEVESFAGAILDAVEHDDWRANAAAQNVDFIKREHDWDVNMAAMEREYEELVRAHRGRRAA